MRPVIRSIGLLLHIPALMALLTLLVCVWFSEQHLFDAFLLTALVATLLGQALYWLGYSAEDVRQHQALLIAALAWLAVSLVGALPFLLIGRTAEGAATVYAPLENALFESLSGFTATGLTLCLQPSQLPHALQWWRSFTQWVGGVGVIVLLLAVLPVARGALQLYYSEGRDEKIMPSVRSTVRQIWLIYIGYTVFSVLLLWAVGEPLWRALNHGMTAIATGGFSITDDGLASVPPLVRLVYLLPLLLGAVSFLIHDRLLRGEGLHDNTPGHAELRLFLGLSFGGAVLLVLDQHWSGAQVAPIDSVFQWVSALTTAGFQSTALANWPTSALLLLCVALTVGGMAGSTAGGVKVSRLLFLLKGFLWQLQDIRRSPRELPRYAVNGSVLNEHEATARVRAATLLIALWLGLLFVLVLLLLHSVPPGTPLEQVLFEIASAQGNVGLSSGLTHPDLSLTGKAALMLAMWMGRLEIVPVLVLGVWVVERG